MDKKVSDSATTMVRLMMPPDANPYGNVFGGTIMKLMDEISAVVALRHARCNVVTASIDRMNFFAPVYVGDLLTLKASVNYVGTTSMEIGVRIEAEDAETGRSKHTGSCYLTYVALDKDGKPAPLPKVVPETPEEKRRWDEALARKRSREAPA
ncbi:MAG: acyl-CoA thioesterase [Nitrososphaerota archaeon]|nr:acyl-CoA thioesterase [Nitrososphaerota archaeon]MDG6939749.1 acyl-CoA thioesterase [Nitrososphaerota archaeon]